MKFIVVVCIFAVVLTATAYPQRSNSKNKLRPKTSRQDLPPASPAPVPEKETVSQNTSQVLTIANNSTPSVVASTEPPRSSNVSVPQPSVVPATAGALTTPVPPSSTRPPVQNGTRGPDEEEEDDSSSEEGEDADADFDVGSGPPGPEEEEADDEDGDEEDDEERAADDLKVNNVVQKSNQNNKKVKPDEMVRRADSGGIDAYVPGYVTDQGEVLVPIDTLERGLEYTIISDRYISIPQQRTTNKQQKQQRNPVYVYRQAESAAKPVEEVSEEVNSSEEESSELIPVKVSETSVIFASKASVAANDTKSEDISNTSQGSSESVEDEDEVKVPLSTVEVKPPPLGAVPATKPTGEDDEQEAGLRRSSNAFRRNFVPYGHYGYEPQIDYMNNVYDSRRLDYPVASDPYSSNFFRSYGGPVVQPRYSYNGPEADASSEESVEDFGRSDDFYDYY